MAQKDCLSIGNRRGRGAASVSLDCFEVLVAREFLNVGGLFFFFHFCVCLAAKNKGFPQDLEHSVLLLLCT